MIETYKGLGVAWANPIDCAQRFGVVMSDPYPSKEQGHEGVLLVDCTTDTFYGDPLLTVPVPVERLQVRSKEDPRHAARR